MKGCHHRLMPVTTTTDGKGQRRPYGGDREDTLERSAVAGGLELLGSHQEGLRAILGGRNGRGDGRQHAVVVIVGGGGGLGLE